MGKSIGQKGGGGKITTHTHTHTHTHTYTHTHTHTHTHMHTHAHTHAHTHTYTCTQARTHTHKHTKTHRLGLILLKIQNMMDIKGVFLQCFKCFLIKKTERLLAEQLKMRTCLKNN